MQADRAAQRRMDELAARAVRTGGVQTAWFLSPAEQAQAAISAADAGARLHLFGGFEAAERKIAAFSAEEEEGPAYPIDCLEVRWHAKQPAPGHRDLLGAIMGLGLDRSRIGDIVLLPGRAYVYVMRENSAYVASSLLTAGRVAVTVQVLSALPGVSPQEAGEVIRGTVASLRLDAVLATGLRLSRAKAVALVASGRVQVGHIQELRADRQLEQGAVISVRGIGRVRLLEVIGTTKKGRTGISLLRT